MHPLTEIGRALNFLFQDQLPTRGIIAFTRSPAVSDAMRARVFFGVHEAALRRNVRRHYRGEHDTVEVGAGIGVISAELARRLAPGRRLICVEPDPELRPLVEQNVAINAPETRLTVLGGTPALADVLAAGGIEGPYVLVVHSGAPAELPPGCHQRIEPRGVR